MAKKKKPVKAKEPIRIRFKELANGNQSIYLDCYTNGKRSYEFLKLYLIPETDEAAKNQNRNTLQAANAIKAQRLISLTNEGAGIKSNPQLSKIPLTDWFEIFVKKQRERGLSEATLQNYQKFKAVLTQFKKHTARLCDIDKAFYLSFIQFLKNDYKGGSGRKKEGPDKKKSETAPRRLTPTSIRSYCTMLNAVLNGAVKAGIMVENPFRRLDTADKVRSEPSTREYLSIDEVKRLISTPCNRPEVKQAYLFACFCGLRISDVEGLTWGSIVEVDGMKQIEMKMHKTRLQLYLPLSAQAEQWMPERGNAKPTDAIFPGMPSRYCTYRNLQTWAKAAGITKRVSFHTSRHTFATMMLTLGADLYTTSKLLGHTKITTTQIYAKIVDAKKVEAVNLVNRIFGEKGKEVEE